MSINRVILVGRLTRDPELKYTQSGVAVCSFTLAVNRPFKNAEGQNEADFINVTVWRKPAENTANYTNKGSLVGIDGRIQTRNYENQEGQRVYVTEVVADSVQFLDTKKQDEGNKGPNPSRDGKRIPDDGPFAGGGQIDIDDDDLPF